MQISINDGQVKKSISIVFFLISLFLVLQSCSLQHGDEWGSLNLDLSAEEAVLKSSDTELPAAIKSLISQADTHIDNRQWPKAITVLERALRINKRQAETWTRMALAYQGQNELEQAIHMAKRSNTYVSKNTKLKAYNWQLISDAYLKLNKLDESQAAALKSQQLQGKD
jgi:tetratricopeptide (TPR) repeat protein